MEFKFPVNFSTSKFSFSVRATELRQIPKFDKFQKSRFRASASNRNLVLKAALSAAGKHFWKGFTFLY